MPLIKKSPVDAASSADAKQPGAALTSGSADERWAAARRFATTPAGVVALSEALAKEDEPRVREAILTRLACAGTAESVAAVLPYLRADDASIRTGALDALRAMPVAVEPFLADLLADADPDVRLLACEIARAISADHATRLLCALLERETQVNVCAAAVEVLAETGGREALPVLACLAERFRDARFLGFAIKVASERIGNQGHAHE